MDPVSALSSSSPTFVTSTVATTAADSVTSTAATAAAIATGAGTTESSDSVRTFFSEFARNLLAQQANNPQLGLDDAASNALFSPGLNPGGQLYNSAGILQQLSTSLFVAQLQSSIDQSNSFGADEPAVNDVTVAQNFGLSGLTDDGATPMLDFMKAYQDMLLLGNLPLFGNQSFSIGMPSFVADEPESRADAPAASVRAIAGTVFDAHA